MIVHTIIGKKNGEFYYRITPNDLHRFIEVWKWARLKGKKYYVWQQYFRDSQIPEDEQYIIKGFKCY